MFNIPQKALNDIFERIAEEISLSNRQNDASEYTWELQVSNDGRRLLYQDGSPFFYLADTAWELFHRCSKPETIFYLKDRQQKGFNVIQAVILAEKDGLRVPNREGEVPFVSYDPLQLNEAYFQHIDWCLEQAQKMGIYLAMLPTWGDKWYKIWGHGPEIFNTPQQAMTYGRMLGERYQKFKNIIWVLGGDRTPSEARHLEINNAMADGIRSQVGTAHLMTYHPGGGKSSSEWFHDTSWLDFNMAQTGHSQKNDPLLLIEHDYNCKPARPCLNGEPQYEAINVAFNPDNERFTAYDARQAAYWSVLSGALGHTYGHNSVWQMWTPEVDKGQKNALTALFPWYYALQCPGALQMGYMRKLFESRPFEKMVPAPNILANVYGQNRQEIRAASCSEGSFVIVYSVYGNPIHLDLTKLNGKNFSGYWYNPREGCSKSITAFTANTDIQVFVPPSSGIENDWILVIDAADKDYSDPAAS